MTVETPSHASGMREAMRLAAVFALVKFAIHLSANLAQAHAGWGYFRDEPYFVLCGRYLDWGYVDHGPIVAVQARLALLLFGRSLAGLRMLTSLAGAAAVFLTGLLSWQMGAKRAGQALAMTGVLLAPAFLASDCYLSMNSFEPVFWMLAASAMLRLIETGSMTWGIVFGLAAGVGLENKPSMLFYLAAMLLALLLTPERRILRSRALLAGAGVALLLVVPNLIWQAQHNLATLRFLHTSRLSHKTLLLSPIPFLLVQVVMLGLPELLIWGAGLVWLLRAGRARRFRFLGFTYLIFLGIMLATRSAREYYLLPVYPFLFAAGGSAWNRMFRPARRAWLAPVYLILLIVPSLLVIPAALPFAPPAAWLSYVTRLGLNGRLFRPEPGQRMAQLYADHFGWQELTDDVTRIYRALPAADQARAGILCTNYGEASAINFLGEGRGLPFAISGHNNYFLWGPHGETGAVLIVITDKPLASLQDAYISVEPAGAMDHPYAMPSARRTIYLCRGRKTSLLMDWPRMRGYS